MFIQHEFQVGNIVLAKFDSYPHWPAKVLTCLKNGSYKVMFLEEKSEAIILPKMIRRLDQENLQKLKREKHNTQPEIANESIKIAQRVLLGRERGNIEEEQEMSSSNRRIQTRRTHPNSTESHTYELNSSKNSSLEKDIYIEIKQLLDKLSKYSVNLSQANMVIKFTSQDKSRLRYLLTEEKLDPKQVIDKFVIQRLIVTICELKEWKTKQFKDLYEVIEGKFNKIKQSIHIDLANHDSLTVMRRKYLLERIKNCRLDVDVEI